MGAMNLFILMRLQIRKTRKVVSLATKSERKGPSIYYVTQWATVQFESLFILADFQCNF